MTKKLTSAIQLKPVANERISTGTLCPGVRKSTISIESVVFLELPHANHTESSHSDYGALQLYSLLDPPSHITLKGTQFTLRAAVEHIPPVVGTGVGHYRTHFKSGAG